MHAERLVAGRYRLLEQIGSGGMGVVWRALDQERQQIVAVKQTYPDGQQAELARRLRREARIVASLDHPHLVAFLDEVSDGGDWWLVLEYVESRSLATAATAGGPARRPGRRGAGRRTHQERAPSRRQTRERAGRAGRHGQTHRLRHLPDGRRGDHQDPDRAAGWHPGLPGTRGGQRGGTPRPRTSSPWARPCSLRRSRSRWPTGTRRSSSRAPEAASTWWWRRVPGSPVAGHRV